MKPTRLLTKSTRFLINPTRFLIKPTKFLIKTTRLTNFPNFILLKPYMFRVSPLPITRSFLLYIRHWYIYCRFDDRFQAESGWNCAPSWLCLEAVEFFDKIKFGKFVGLVGFIKKKFVTMHGHMLRWTVTCYDALSRVTMHCHVLRCTVTCYDALSHVTMNCHVLRCTVTCYDELSRVTMHCHVLRCTVTCYDALSRVTMHCHMLRCTVTWT